MRGKFSDFRIFLICVMIVTTSMAGCLGNESSDSEETSESSDCGDSAPWLFVMNIEDVTIDLIGDVPDNDSANGANMTISNAGFVGAVTAYTEAVEGERGSMRVIDDHYSTLLMLSAEKKNGAITGFMDDGGEVTVTFKLINAYNNSLGATNNSSDGAFLSAELIGVNDNNGDIVNGTSFHLDNASYLIDSWWCEVLVSVGVAAAIGVWCVATDGACLSSLVDEDVVAIQAEKMTEAVTSVVEYFGEDWGASTYDGIYKVIYAGKGLSLASMIEKVIDYICDL